MNNKNIYIVGGNREVKTGGGANISLNSLEEYLKSFGFNVYAVGSAIDKSGLISFGMLDHVSFSPLLGKFSFVEVYKNWKSGFSLLLYCLRTTVGLEKIKNNNDIIVNNGHWCTNANYLVIRFLMKSYISRLRKIGVVKNNISIFDIKSKIILWIERKMLFSKSVKKIIVLSEEGKKNILISYPKLLDKIIVVPNGVNKKQFIFSKEKRTEVRNRFGINETEIVLLFVGGNIFRKNLSFAIKVVKTMPKNTRFFILVKDDEVTQAKGMLLGYKGAIILSWESDPSKYYSASDILIAPTIYDPAAKVILEALVNGLFCVVSNNSGVGEFIDKGEGEIIDGFSIIKYRKAIDAFTKSKIHRSQIKGELVWDWKNVSMTWKNLFIKNKI